MAKPSSRQELIDYCLRQLGEPVLEINVDDDQIEDAVDDAIQFFHERHFDGCLLYTSPSPRDSRVSRMPSSA